MACNTKLSRKIARFTTHGNAQGDIIFLLNDTQNSLVKLLALRTVPYINNFNQKSYA